MRLLLIGAERSQVCSWDAYVLLRDNVQHYLEHGQPSARFMALHAIEAAVDDVEVRVDAARLRGELLSACRALWHVPVGSSKAGASNGNQGWSVPDATPIPLAAEHFVSVTLALTEAASDGDILRVRAVN